MIKQRELALLIQKGMEEENVTESESYFFEDMFGNFHVCALGAGLIGKFGSARKAYELVQAEREVHVELESREMVLFPEYVDIAAALLEIDFDLAEAIDKTHMLGVPAMVITKRLGEETFPY